ncbi:potassium transporter TrkH [Vitiosangium sp. GDMCC 1.1324]|uniref:potassium transporter TrkH n=1 Tax=Vitiosangium sp. (strain GDMCC 1.1324) TaxID=2138576 RepID=UPI000D3D5DEE|nr:potassium transporter TrkH [Vitiosangium sp. GDMCC 1.1324]PTL83807.1 potassium transporter TrkH [Vitiosangium sp. GDMCC 1.1324]
MKLRAGEGVIEVDDRLVPLLAQRCSWSHLQPSGQSAGPRLELTVCPVSPEALARGSPLDAQRPGWGSIEVEAERVVAHIPPDPFAAEAALRAAVLVSVLRQGGVLLHAAAVAFSGKALVIVGPSGAGKSTLARSAVAAGGALLSDETVALLPSGLVHGSPFRSDPDLVPACEAARLARLVWVVKGPAESVSPVDAPEAVRLLLQQAYRPLPGTVSLPELTARAVVQTGRVGLHRFTCRKSPDAGTFARDFVSGA